MMASIAEMLRHYGFKTMRDFMIAHGIADLAAGIMSRQGHKVRFPSVVTEENGTQYIEEYYGG